MSSNSGDLLQLRIPREDFVNFAAIAWNGHKLSGRGAVILEIVDTGDENTESELNDSRVFYLPASATEIQVHAAQHKELSQWISQYDPKQDFLLAVAHPVGVFYALLTPPELYPPASEASPDKSVDVSEAMSFSGSSIMEEWPILCGIARSDYSNAAQGEIIVTVPSFDKTAIDSAVKLTLEKAESEFIETLRKNAPAMLAEHRTLRAGFENRLHERWGKALDLYEIILVTSQEAGSHFVKKHREQAVKENDLVFSVLVRLHARACLIASEVFALLRSGHAAGAHTRWRSLHEIVSVVYFVKQFGQDIAERYLEHEHIEAWKATKEYQQHCTRLGYQPYSASEIAAFQQQHDRLLAKYGKNFGNDYGWAEAAVRKLNSSYKGRVTFAQIERTMGMNHWRPFYRMASHGVHANPKSVTFNLGLIKQGEFLLAGPSNAGLADAGNGACISLVQATSALLTLKSADIDSMLAIQALLRFEREAGEEFLNAQRRLEEDETILKANEQG
jgi:hypothetical protein